MRWMPEKYVGRLATPNDTAVHADNVRIIVNALLSVTISRRRERILAAAFGYGALTRGSGSGNCAR